MAFLTQNTAHQGCQMVYFQAENPNLGNFSRASKYKRLVIFMAIWNIIQHFSIFYGHLEI
jgi:hypothetical protein